MDKITYESKILLTVVPAAREELSVYAITNFL